MELFFAVFDKKRLAVVIKQQDTEKPVIDRSDINLVQSQLASIYGSDEKLINVISKTDFMKLLKDWNFAGNDNIRRYERNDENKLKPDLFFFEDIVDRYVSEMDCNEIDANIRCYSMKVICGPKFDFSDETINLFPDVVKNDEYNIKLIIDKDIDYKSRENDIKTAISKIIIDKLISNDITVIDIVQVAPYVFFTADRHPIEYKISDLLKDDKKNSDDLIQSYFDPDNMFLFPDDDVMEACDIKKTKDDINKVINKLQSLDKTRDKNVRTLIEKFDNNDVPKDYKEQYNYEILHNIIDYFNKMGVTDALISIESMKILHKAEEKLAEKVIVDKIQIYKDSPDVLDLDDNDYNNKIAIIEDEESDNTDSKFDGSDKLDDELDEFEDFFSDFIK